MLRNIVLSSLLAIAQMVGLAGVAVAQDMSTIMNVTNTCIKSTYKFWTPNMAAPTLIIIDRRVTFNPVTVCGTATMSMSASCMEDPGVTMFLGASAFGPQITMNPYCNWNCGACGTIVINASNGLPVELLDFSVNDAEEGKEDPGPDAPGTDPRRRRIHQ